MRELPEPEGYYFREDSGYIGGGETIRTGDFTLEQVLAIQKQAYEDGLRDAANFPTDALTVNLVRIVGMNKHLARKCELVVRAMLTASQEKK